MHAHTLFFAHAHKLRSVSGMFCCHSVGGNLGTSECGSVSVSIRTYLNASISMIHSKSQLTINIIFLKVSLTHSFIHLLYHLLGYLNK